MRGAESTIASVMRRRFSGLLLATLGALAIDPRNETKVRAAGDESLDAALASRLHRIEAAFRAGDANSLRQSFSGKGKVTVDLKEVAGGQSAYAPGQLQVIFRHIFDDSRTRDFSFDPKEVRVPSQETAFARGRWVRRGAAGGPESVDTLTFTLREESGDWRVLEIRASR